MSNIFELLNNHVTPGSTRGVCPVPDDDAHLGSAHIPGLTTAHWQVLSCPYATPWPLLTFPRHPGDPIYIRVLHYPRWHDNYYFFVHLVSYLFSCFFHFFSCSCSSSLVDFLQSTYHTNVLGYEPATLPIQLTR